MILVLVLFCVGMSLSAFFSGSETGFYRLSRARLLIRALEGNWSARGLLWAINNPSIFVATALVGNNVANYTTSLAIVMAASILASGWESAELILPLLMAPVIFVYGELLPKHVFLAAPNRLLRRCAVALGVAAVLFAPISAILWLVNKLLEFIGRKSPEELRMVLARRELGELMEEGQAIGILRPTQQALAQSTLALAAQPVANFVTPVSRFPRVATSMKPREVARIAERGGRSLLPVESTITGRRETVGYTRSGDCLLATDGKVPVLSLMEVDEREPYLMVLSTMLNSDAELARVTNRRGQTVGFVTLSRLQDALLAD